MHGDHPCPWGRLAAIWPTISGPLESPWKTAWVASEVEEGLQTPLYCHPRGKKAKTGRYLALGVRLGMVTSECWPKAATLSDMKLIYVPAWSDAYGKRQTHVHVDDHIQRSGWQRQSRDRKSRKRRSRAGASRDRNTRPRTPPILAIGAIIQ